jgi:hypothetical protein
LLSDCLGDTRFSEDHDAGSAAGCRVDWQEVVIINIGIIDFARLSVTDHSMGYGAKID